MPPEYVRPPEYGSPADLREAKMREWEERRVWLNRWYGYAIRAVWLGFTCTVIIAILAIWCPVREVGERLWATDGVALVLTIIALFTMFSLDDERRKNLRL
jgi:hypothetical protein